MRARTDDQKAVEVLDTVAHEGAPSQIGLNARYLLEALKAALGDSVRIAHGGLGEPVVLSSPTNAGLTQLIMQLRI